jgi:hypothetical protein
MFTNKDRQDISAGACFGGSILVDAAVGRFGMLPVLMRATNLMRDKNKVKPFVVSLSNHERLDHAPFDKLRANG